MKKARKRIGMFLVVMLIVTIVHCPVTYAETSVETSTERSEEASTEPVNSNTYIADDFDVNFDITNQWEDHFSATITIKNTNETAIENWYLSFSLEQEIENL